MTPRWRGQRLHGHRGARRVSDWGDLPTDYAEVYVKPRVGGDGVCRWGLLARHSQGGEYTGGIFAAACRSAGVTESTGRTGSALDNAVAESFNSTLKWEFWRDNHFHTHEKARHAVAASIDAYNSQHHSALGYMTPAKHAAACRRAPHTPVACSIK
jgi:hypothetical protein